MSVAFVASNPSHTGSLAPTKRVFAEWVRVIGLTNEHTFFNVSNDVTPDNRPLRKSEYGLGRLAEDLRGFSRVVALGHTASAALRCLGLAHFRLPHPSPKNRPLNDRDQLVACLVECGVFLRDGVGAPCRRVPARHPNGVQYVMACGLVEERQCTR